MLKQITVSVIFLVLATGVAAQSNNVDWFAFLKLPDPDCGLNCHWNNKYSDSLLSRTDLTIPRLQSIIYNGYNARNPVIAHAYLSLADIYYHLDSSITAYQHLIKARELYAELYQNKQTSENAFFLGRTYDIDQQSDLDDSAQFWYRQAIDLDADNYQAYFEYTDGIDERSVEEKAKWLEKCQALVNRLLSSDIAVETRAEIASKYAGIISGTGLINNIKDFFISLPEIIMQTDDSTDEDSLAGEIFSSFMNKFYNPQAALLMKYAADTYPQGTNYLVDYAGVELFRIFSVLFQNTQAFEDDSFDILQYIYSKESDALKEIHQRLEKVSLNERSRFPAVYYYLAIAEFMSSDFDQAYHNICLFNQLDPDNQSGYGLHCGIIVSRCKKEKNDMNEWMSELISLSEEKCASSPTEADCYRAGFLLLYQGELVKSYQAFDQAILNSADRSLAPLIGKAIVCLLLEDYNQMQRIINVLNDRQQDMDEPTLLSYYHLQAVINILDGQTERAILWAQKATLKSPDNEAAQLLYSTLQSLR